MMAAEVGSGFPGRAHAWKLVAAAIAALLIVAVLVIAMFPWGMLKPQIERRLSAAIGQPVSISGLRRVDAFSFHPMLDASGIRIPQPSWAGGGDLARIGSARVRFSVWPLLAGRFSPEAVEVRGVRLALVRTADGRKNWQARNKPDRGGARPEIERLTIADTIVSYADAKQKRSAIVRVEAHEARGLRVRGTGTIHGQPVSISARGAAISGQRAAQPWPFRVVIAGDAVGMTLQGRMERALDVGHFTAQATAHGIDLAILDAIIEAGLPGTQPVRVQADVRHAAPDWRVDNLSGTIGQSDVAGEATIRKRDGRTRIDGAIRSNRFDFDDLSSNEGLRIAAAKHARLGPRLVPDTAIDLKNVDDTDGKLQLSAKQLLWPGSSPFRSLRGTLTVERSLLTLDRLVLGLARGRIVGFMRVDQRGGAPVLDAGLDIQDARLIDFFPGAAIDGSLVGNIRLKGPGKTIRAAVGRSSGSIALVARDGVIPARTASLLGQDVGRGITTGKQEQATLRCIVARLDVTNGIARANPVVIDTSRARTTAAGAVNLADERLSLILNGAPKRSSLLRLAGPVPIGGTIKAPDIRVPEGARSVGGVLKMLGRAIAGEQGALAVDADCAGLAARALG